MDLQHPSFFIFGPERSGTTLLTFLLSGQPRTFVLNDSFVFDRYVEWALLREHRARSGAGRLARMTIGLMPSIRLRSIEDLRYWRRLYYAARARYALELAQDQVLSSAEIRGYNLTLRARYLASLDDERPSFLNGYVNGLPQPAEESTLQDVFSQTITSLSSLFVDSPGLTLGEKTPIHTPYAKWIMDLYPHSRAILMVRDPVANVASIFKRYGNFRRSVEAYEIYAESLLTLAESARIMTVRHEDVITSTSTAIENILRFIDPALPFDPSCPVNSYTKTEYTGKSVDPSRVGATPGTLTPKQEREVMARFSEIEHRFY